MSEVPPPSGANTPPSTPIAANVPDPADVEKNKVFAALAYLGILFLVPLLAAKDSPFAKFHTNQGLVLFLAEIACCICVGIISVVVGFIPFVGICISCVLWLLLVVACLVPAIMGLISALNGQMKPLPVIGSFKILK